MQEGISMAILKQAMQRADICEWLADYALAH